MFRRAGGGSPAPSRFWRVEVGRRQIEIVKSRVEFELIRRRLEVSRKVAGPEDYEGVRQLELRLVAMTEAEKDLQRIKVKKKTLWDRFMVWLWDWSTRGRFDFDEKHTQS